MDNHRYDDLLELPHPTSQRHPRMSPQARAAQFSPFAALTGYDQAILAMQHQRCNPVQLSEGELDVINEMLANLQKKDAVTLTYFHHDPGPDGTGRTAAGEYLELSGTVLQISFPRQTLRIELDTGWKEIAFSDLLIIQLELPGR